MNIPEADTSLTYMKSKNDTYVKNGARTKVQKFVIMYGIPSFPWLLLFTLQEPPLNNFVICSSSSSIFWASCSLHQGV